MVADSLEINPGESRLQRQQSRIRVIGQQKGLREFEGSDIYQKCQGSTFEIVIFDIDRMILSIIFLLMFS